MNSLQLVGLLVLSLLTACSSAALSAQAGFAQVSVGGTVALANGSGGISGSVEQDIDSGFGLGGDQGSPFVRAEADFGGPVLTASGFVFEETGEGTLEANFGGLSQATAVTSKLEFGCAKVSASYEFILGLVKVSPGLAVDVFDIDFRASDLFGNSEVIDEVVAVPMLFVRAEANLGVLWAIGEAGYLETPEIDASKGRFLDLETMLGWSPLPSAQVFAGYRYIDIDATGDTGTESFGIDMHIRGWFVGGGIGF